MGEKHIKVRISLSSIIDLKSLLPDSDTPQECSPNFLEYPISYKKNDNFRQ